MKADSSNATASSTSDPHEPSIWNTIVSILILSIMWVCLIQGFALGRQGLINVVVAFFWAIFALGLLIAGVLLVHLWFMPNKPIAILHYNRYRILNYTEFCVRVLFLIYHGQIVLGLALAAAQALLIFSRHLVYRNNIRLGLDYFPYA